jgi:23S rRNA (cytidine1920-2'-O)/16S rRNA (cytidine1409-2'-O)-methyltransferase
MARLRADQLLVARGLFESRARAQAAIEAGLIVADGTIVAKASSTLPTNAKIEAAAPHPYVSRGGVKLAAAMDAFGINPAGHICLDVGASTGGFSDALLQRGAARIFAIDVGHGQLHPKVAGNRRVTSFEGQDIRALDAELVQPAPELGVIDVSFISLALVLPAVARLLAPSAALVALIKPQFEAGRAALKKGIVRDAEVHARVCTKLRQAVAALGFDEIGLIPSPVEGGDGNLEFLIGARRR